MASDLFQQGVEAFQAGDKARAKMLLQEATSIDPTNENAWYYLAAAETDNLVRRQYLERVLEINPNHARAREVLMKLDNREAAAAAGIPPVSAPPKPPTTAPPPPASTPPLVATTPIRPLDPDAGAIPGSDATGGFVLPVTIPGAPPQVSLKSLWSGGWQLFQHGLDVLQRKAGVYEAEAARATWWRFWLLLGFGYAINAVLSTVSTLIFQAQLSSLGFRFNILAVILALILTAPLGMIVLYAGVYTSHWWAKRQGGQVPLFQHAYAVALPYIPAWVIGSAIGVVFSLIGFGAGLIPLIVSIYALYVMALGFENLYRFSDPNQKYFTVLAMFVGFIVAGIIVGAIQLAIFGVSSAGVF
jgi:tetratricopeptide (TPR) repeat protein